MTMSAQNASPDGFQRSSRFDSDLLERAVARVRNVMHGEAADFDQAVCALLEVPGFTPSQVLASRVLVTSLLVPALADAKIARTLLRMMQRHWFRYAGPLLPAFEAAIINRPDRLDYLEPEIRRAAKILYGRINEGVLAAVDLPGIPSVQHIAGDDDQPSPSRPMC